MTLGGCPRVSNVLKFYQQVSVLCFAWFVLVAVRGFTDTQPHTNSE